MARPVLPLLLLAIGLGGLAGCSKFERAERPAWRTRAENACFAQRRVAMSAYVQPAAREIDGPSICGLTKPLKVTALQGGAVLFNSTQTLDCPMVAELDAWLADMVQPAAQARFGQPVVQIDSMGSYSCRGMNNQIGARLSEHSFGNALDIGGFRLADGRQVTLVRDWTRGDPQTQAFLRDIHNGACEHFATVLSPGSNPFHYNHIHVDLAMHGMSSSGPRRICKPAQQNTVAPPSPKDNLPETPEFDDDLDIAQAGAPRGPAAYATTGGANLALSGAAPDPIRRPPPPVPATATTMPQTSAPQTAIAQAPLGPPPGPPRRPSGLAPVSLHAQLPADEPLAPPSRERRGAMREDGAYVPEGAPSDFDLPPSRPRR
ncbi:extensin family protein [Rhodoblastus sp. 17X3]|uniref:extensin-like domain-containing protein n=1 Tax=Rhodoblastus sp. 17X3 TaxID=3047026 RepID=UPI0024B735D2|nr:extensin family protein [Rhodoblastus sp. 17X3]MDI9846873.1 extensin family protein [Rhodoblastus sp. 17X3]